MHARRKNDDDRGHVVRRIYLFRQSAADRDQVFYPSAVVPQLTYVNRDRVGRTGECGTRRGGAGGPTAASPAAQSVTRLRPVIRCP